VSKKVRRVPYRLHPERVHDLSRTDIAAILRGADELIMRGGRSLLARVLKGSRETRVLELGLDKSPVYGYYKGIPIEEVLARIDWAIQRGYLAIEYDHRLPLLVYTERGWEIERETYATELFDRFNRMLDSPATDHDMHYLKDRDRGLIMLLLEKIEASGDLKYVPLLRAWRGIEYKKVRARIQSVIENLSKGAS